MIRALVIVGVFLGACTATAAAQAEDRGLRLEEAVRRALEHNERSRQAKLRIDAAEGGVARSRAAFFPTLTAQGSVTADVGPQPEGRTQDRWNTVGTLTLTQPIVTPSAWPTYAQARHQLNAERAGSAQELRVLAFDTARAFLEALAAEQVLAAARSRLDRAQANLDDAKARADAQLASTNDATRTALDVASAARDVAQQEGAGRRAYLELSLVVGEEIKGPLVPPGGAARIDALLAQGTDPLVRGASDRRADLRELHARTEAAEAAAAEPNYRLAPTLSAQAQARAFPDPQPQSPSYEITVGLNLNWQIFDAGVRYADLRTRSAQAASARLEESLARRGVKIDVRSAIISFQAARTAYRIAEDAVVAAKQNSEETTVLYRQGLARSLELSDANSRLFDAEVTRVSAKLALEQACIELRFALGLDPIERVPVTGSAAR